MYTKNQIFVMLIIAGILIALFLLGIYVIKLKKKTALIIVAGILLLWIFLYVSDLKSVYNEKEPTFCIKTKEYHYVGLGYSYVIIPRISDGKWEYCENIFGITVENNLTN